LTITSVDRQIIIILAGIAKALDYLEDKNPKALTEKVSPTEVKNAD
jgi:hypothetical protein